MKNALITGITGQDGWYLAEHLYSLGYRVHGFIRRTSRQYAAPKCTFKVHHGSLECYDSIVKCFSETKFDEIYHLAAQSFVQESFFDAGTTLNVNIGGTQRLFDAIRQYNPQAKVYFAGSSEVFGNEPSPQNESTRFSPRSPYGVSKAAGIHLARVYASSYNMFISSGILFNHESPRRGPEFVTQKVCTAAAINKPVKLGNLEAKRDWGDAREYVKAMYLMLQQPQCGEFVVATGYTNSVKTLCDVAYKHVGLDPTEYVTVSQSLRRPSEVDELCGDATRANTILGWYPTVKFSALIKDMVDHAQR